MKSKDVLNTIPKNNNSKVSRIKPIAIIVFGLIGMILTVVCGTLLSIHFNDEYTGDKAIVQSELYKARIREYLLACSRYDAAVENYNKESQDLNSLIKKLADKNLLENASELKSKDRISREYNSMALNEAEIKIISEEADCINEKASILNSQHKDVCEIAYDGCIKEYSMLSKEYNAIIEKTSIDFIEDIPAKAESLDEIPFVYISDEEALKNIDSLSEKNDELAVAYMIVKQITAPDEKWVEKRLRKIDSIEGLMAVSENNDPNNLLGKEGGYISCTYFTAKSIDSSKIKGISIVDKGTDAGGAIEVYSDLATAKTRCEYLSQFDDSLLYSGSYALVGTMVIRTSYKLSDAEQVDLTNEIVTAFTAIDNN